MSQRIDDPPTPRLTVHVLDGRSTVDCAHLDALVGLLGGALEAAADARRALAQARAVVMLCDTLAPLTGPATLAVLDDAELCRVAGLAHALDALRDRVAAAAATYAEAENTARAALDRQPGRPGWLLALPERFGLAVGPLLAVWRHVVGGVSARGAGLPAGLALQPHLRGAALALGPVANPTGEVVGRRGPAAAAGMPPVPFLASSLLDLTGLDHYGGSGSVWVRDPGTGAPVAGTVSPWGLGAGAVVPVGASLAVAPVRSVADMVRRVGGAAAAADATGVGRIEVIGQSRRDGRTGWTVVIPGTRETAFAANPQDHLSNVQLVGAEDSDVLLAARRALELAPIAPGDPVVLAGHSQGGIVAAELAADPDVTGRFALAGVVTLGSPIGQVTGIPDDVPVIRVENLDDMIPALDGLANADGDSHLTVQFSAPAHTAVFGPHDLRTYEAAYSQALADGASADLAALDAAIRDAAGWSDPDATARAYAFEFARTERDRELLEALHHAGLAVR